MHGGRKVTAVRTSRASHPLTHPRLTLRPSRSPRSPPADAAGLLREAYDILSGGAQGGAAGAGTGGDPGPRAEAGLYLDCVALAHVRDAGGVAELQGSFMGHVRALKVGGWGRGDMCVSA